MAISYADWPTGEDIIDFMTKVGLVPSNLVAGDDGMLMRIDSMSASIEQKTKRQFVETASELRQFDGSGVQVQEVDDYTDITKIEIQQFGAVQGLELTEFVEKKREHYPKTRIYLRQGSGRVFWGNYFLDRFPEGYANIEVTALWGYAALIPKDVWFAHLLLVVSDVIDAEGMELQGRVLNWKEGDVSETYYPRPPSEAAGWEKHAWQIIDSHRRPFAHHKRRAKAKIY